MVTLQPLTLVPASATLQSVASLGLGVLRSPATLFRADEIESLCQESHSLSSLATSVNTSSAVERIQLMNH